MATSTARVLPLLLLLACLLAASLAQMQPMEDSIAEASGDGGMGGQEGQWEREGQWEQEKQEDEDGEVCEDDPPDACIPEEPCVEKSVLDLDQATAALSTCRLALLARGAAWEDPDVPNPDPQGCFNETSIAFLVYVLEEKTRMCREQMPKDCPGGRSAQELDEAAARLRACRARLAARGLALSQLVAHLPNPDPACLAEGSFGLHVALLEVKAALCNDVNAECPPPPSEEARAAASTSLAACLSNLQARGVNASLPPFLNPDPECILQGTLNYEFNENTFKLAACRNISYCPSRAVTSQHVQAADFALRDCLKKLESFSTEFFPEDFINPDPDCIQGLAEELLSTQDKTLQCYNVLPGTTCPERVSVTQFNQWAQELRECRARVVELTGSEPVFPEFIPPPSCKLDGFNLHARTMEFRAKYCHGRGTKPTCPERVSVSQFQEWAQELRECRARVVELTGSEPVFPEFIPPPSCKLEGFNLHARTMEFRAKYCDKLRKAPCPERVSVTQFQEWAQELRECRARVVKLTGSEPVFPDFIPPLSCDLDGFNLHARTMEFRAKYCKALVMSDDMCPERVSVIQFNQWAQELRECRARVVELTGREPVFPEFLPPPSCKLDGFNLHARTMEFRADFCEASLMSDDDVCPERVSVTQFNQWAEELRECRARVVELTGSEPVFPDFIPPPSCDLTGFNLHARKMEFRAKHCQTLLVNPPPPTECPPKVSVAQFQEFAENLRFCSALYLARTGKQPSFPPFSLDPDCGLSNFNHHARLMEFRANHCQSSLNALGAGSPLMQK